MIERLVDRLSKRTMAVLVLVLAAAVIASLVVISGSDGEEASAQDSGVPTMPLERRSLAEQISVDGTLGYGDEAAVINRLSGTVTWLPLEGAEIGRGERLFDIDDEPVILMYGTVPAYRRLSSGVSGGADVKQLEANLAELGFDAGGSMTVDSEFTSATTEAVSEWQESLGLDETGSVELGRVIFQAGERRVSSLDVELGASADSGSGSASAVGASTTSQGTELVLASQIPPEPSEPTEQPAVDGQQGEEPQDGAGSGDSADNGKAPKGTGGPRQGERSDAQTEAQPQTEVQEAAPSGSSEGDAEASGASEGGSGADAGASPSTQVMTASAVRRTVSVELDPEQVEMARRGSEVDVTLPGGDEVKGRIASVGTVAAAAASDSGETTEGQATEDATIEVTITLPGDRAAGALDEAPVTVGFTEEVRKGVLAVPVSALIGTVGDQFAIVAAAGGESRQLAVEPGLFADGYVEISGDGLEEGLEVEVPEE